LPVAAEGIGAVRANRNNLNTSLLKLTEILAQLRQVLSAVWSHKAAQQYQDYRLASVCRKADFLSAGVDQLKIRCLYALLDSQFHIHISLFNFQNKFTCCGHKLVRAFLLGHVTTGFDHHQLCSLDFR
jgi:hypothetical protein